jgi:oxalate---CoA ligase
MSAIVIDQTSSRLPVRPRSGVTEGTLSDIIRERARELGHRTYLEHVRDGRSLSFRDLDHAVTDWCSMLTRTAVGAGTTVGLVVGDPLEFSVAYLATIACGAWAAPLNPATPVHGTGGLATDLARVGAQIVFSDRPHPAGVDVRWVEIGQEQLYVSSGRTGAAVEGRGSGDTGGAVLSSSGTTGPPKVIPVHQSQLLCTARHVSSHHGLGPSERGFNSLPLFHINAEVVGLLASLVAGSCLVLDDGFHRTRFWELMDERKITWINAVPAIISRLADPLPDEAIPDRIRFARSASAPLPVATCARFEANTGIPVVETYGMTEAASQITANPVSGTRKPGSVGLPVGVELRVVAQGEPVAAGTTGLVEIRGASVITTYGGGHHSDRIDRDGWLRTGDLGHLDEDGYLYLDARSDDVINRGGEKIYPREIEEVLLADPQVAAAAVVGMHDDELGQVPVAFIVLRHEDPHADRGAVSVVAERIRMDLGAALVRSKRPVSLRVVQELPAGATGKVQHHVLRQDLMPVIHRLDLRWG